MGRVYEALDEGLSRWLGQQHLFFVASAPDDPEGHINLSPKGAMDSFRVLGPTTVAYVDMLGSDIETVAHLRQNGRIVHMFCAFQEDRRRSFVCTDAAGSSPSANRNLAT